MAETDDLQVCVVVTVNRYVRKIQYTCKVTLEWSIFIYLKFKRVN